jgi:hypothetical protein
MVFGKNRVAVMGAETLALKLENLDSPKVIIYG